MFARSIIKFKSYMVHLEARFLMFVQVYFASPIFCLMFDVVQDFVMI